MWWVRLFLGLLLALPAVAAVPVVTLTHAMPDDHLDGQMSVAVLPADAPTDPEAFWRAEAGSAHKQPGTTHWQVEPGQRVVGRVTLQSWRERDIYVIEVPLTPIDQVQVWYREPGRPWQGAEAGDRVPLSRWPFFGQFPGFPLPMSEAPLDVIVTVVHDSRNEVPILIKTDRNYRQDRLLQGNMLGVLLGVGLMGALVCLATALSFRTRASWVLFAYAAWAFVMIGTMSGHTAIWLTPDEPWFNDRSKHFSGVVMAGLVVAVTVEMLEQLDFWAPLRWLGAIAVALSVVYGAAQAWLLPISWRPAGGVTWAAACVLLSLALCAVSYLRGGRYVGWIALGLVLAVLVVVLTAVIALSLGGIHFSHTFDVRTIFTSLLLFGSAQVLRHTLYRRDRFGRDILGRAAIASNRDPLTALLSYNGVQQAYEEATLRQAAGRGATAVMQFTLPGFDEAAADHGFVLTERALVRFAAGLQQILGNEWAIGRLSKARFLALTTHRGAPDEIVQYATRVLTHCARESDPLSAVADFDLRIVCAHQARRAMPFGELLRELEDSADLMEEGKRIAVL